jgi:hypothetical protein
MVNTITIGTPTTTPAGLIVTEVINIPATGVNLTVNKLLVDPGVNPNITLHIPITRNVLSDPTPYYAFVSYAGRNLDLKTDVDGNTITDSDIFDTGTEITGDPATLDIDLPIFTYPDLASMTIVVLEHTDAYANPGDVMNDNIIFQVQVKPIVTVDDEHGDLVIIDFIGDIVRCEVALADPVNVWIKFLIDHIWLRQDPDYPSNCDEDYSWEWIDPSAVLDDEGCLPNATYDGSGNLIEPAVANMKTPQLELDRSIATSSSYYEYSLKLYIARGYNNTNPERIVLVRLKVGESW